MTAAAVKMRLTLLSRAAAAAVALAAFAPCRPAAAFEFVSTNQFRAAPGVKLGDQLWLAARSVTIDADAADDLFLLSVAGDPARGETGRIAFGGSAESDLWAAAAGSAAIGGRVARHARVVSARDVRISGAVGGDLMCCAASVHVAKQASVARDAFLAGRDVTIEGRIEGSALVLASRATISGLIGGDLRIEALDVVFMPGTSVGGDLVYLPVPGRELVLGEDVRVCGRVRKLPVGAAPRDSRPSRGIWVREGLFLFNATMCGILFISLFPGSAWRSAYLLRRFPFRCFVLGFMFLFFAASLSLISFLTLAGIPLGLFLAAFCALTFYVGKVAPAMVLGGLLVARARLPASRATIFSTLVAGLAMVFVFVNVPAMAGQPGLGNMVKGMLAVMGAGALCFAAMERRAIESLGALQGRTPEAGGAEGEGKEGGAARRAEGGR